MESEDRIEGHLYRDRCLKRIKFYNKLSSSPGVKSIWNNWEAVQVDRFVAEYLLSQGMFQSAAAIADKCQLTVKK